MVSEPRIWSLVPPKTHRRGRMHIKSVESRKLSPVDAVKVVEGLLQLRCPPCHLTMVQKLCGPSPQSSSTEQCELKLQLNSLIR
ncbi:hypothetical protein TNCV_947331 [Trichonephila clavipes]|nr:hypothetical protein TNCV_947331 [Trichonephila clavipes]